MTGIISPVAQRLNYYRRIYTAYATGRRSHLTFWHGDPELNEGASCDRLGEYYMSFTGKADYTAELDEEGIPLLNYHGTVGLQYNPIAIAQYGLGNFNLYKRTGREGRRTKFLRSANWLLDNLEQNRHGLAVWNHHFDWDYRSLLKAPWYSGLAQGQGISLLLRANLETGMSKYLEAAGAAFQAFLHDLGHGGVSFRDEEGYLWFEEYIVHPLPPTHVLNGFIWALWGIIDYFLATGDEQAERLIRETTRTVRDHLPAYDIGYWSLYELTPIRPRMIASHFYHRLHIVQLEVMHRLTGEDAFRVFADRWQRYCDRAVYRSVASAHKLLFKLLYY